MRFLHLASSLLARIPKHGCALLTPKFIPQVHNVHRYTKRKFPDLLYFPHIFRWLSAKLRFFYLKNAWDPDFTEGGFIYGSIAAICRITDIIHRDELDHLNQYMTDAALVSLKGDIKYKVTNLQKQIIKLEPVDIKLLVPMKVQLVRDKKNRRYAFVLLKSLAMKWYEEKQGVKLVLVVLETEFKRDYTEGVKPEWMISIFNIVQCVLIGSNTPVHK